MGECRGLTDMQVRPFPEGLESQHRSRDKSSLFFDIRRTEGTRVRLAASPCSYLAYDLIESLG